MSYPLVAISEFCKTGSGGTPSRKNPEYVEGNIPWVKSGELRESVVLSTGEHISNLAVEKSSAKVCSKRGCFVGYVRCNSWENGYAWY